MAHLARCWCGRTYRCEQDHTPPPNILRALDIEPRHDDCPDFILHGPWTVNFKTVTMPVIRNGEFHAVSIVDAIQANSMKEIANEYIEKWKNDPHHIPVLNLPLVLEKSDADET